MKVIALNGSPHKKGNTVALLKTVCAEIEAEGIKTKLIHLPPLKLQPCIVCRKCAKKKDNQCHGVKDGLNDLLAKVYEADGLLVGSPTWFANANGHVKNFIDRCGFISRVNGFSLNHKVGAAVVAARRAGAVPTMDAIDRMFQLNGMVIPCATYWNLGMGLAPGDCLKDEEGIKTMKSLGQNMAWLLKKLA